MFITAVLKASEMAQRTHQKEDLDVLRNAVINSDKKIDIKDSIRARNIRNYCRNSTAK